MNRHQQHEPQHETTDPMTEALADERPESLRSPECAFWLGMWNANKIALESAEDSQDEILVGVLRAGAARALDQFHGAIIKAQPPRPHVQPDAEPQDVRVEHLWAARLVKHPTDALPEARRALKWVAMAHRHLSDQQPDGLWCDDAREGLAHLLDMIGAKLDVADESFTGSPNREWFQR